IYAEDGSAEAENPYVITEQNFQVRRLQPSRGELRYGVFYAFAREAVSISTERNPSDPRVSHQFTLDVDVFGNVTRQASISYGRQGTIDDETVFDEQKQAWATLTETDFINRPDEDDWYRVGVQYQQRTFELTGLDQEVTPFPEAGTGLVSFDELKTALDNLTAPDLPFETIGDGT